MWLEKLKHATKIDNETMTYLQKVNLEKVVVCEEKKNWCIHLKSTNNLDEKFAQKVEKLFEDAFPNVKKVKVLLKLNKEESIDLESFSEKNWNELVKFLKEELPVAAGYLANSSCEIENNNIIISIPNKLGKEILKQRATRLICKWFEDKCKTEVQVKFVVKEVDTSEEADKLQDIMLAKARVAATENRPEPKSVAPKADNKLNQSQSRIILGKKIGSEIPVVPIETITEEEKQICIKGEIFDLEEITFKTGRKLFSLYITDKTDSITIKVFSPDKGNFQPEKFKKGAFVKVQGPVKFDTYSNELVLMAYNIQEATIESQKDLEDRKRVELHLHTKMSSMDGVSSLEAFVKRAAEWSHSAIAITDHGVVQAFPDAADLGEKYGVKIIYGMEGYLVDDTTGDPDFLKKRANHIVILAKDYVGLKNLYKLVSMSHLNYFFRQPRIPKSVLEQYREGLIIGSGCEAGELISKYLDGADEDKLREIASFYDYLEIQPKGNNEFLVREGVTTEEGLEKMNQFIVELGQSMQKPVVATGDVHFLDETDCIYREILMRSKGFNDAENQPPLYYRSTKAMLEEFAYLGSETAYEVVVENTNNITNQIEDLKPIPDSFYPPAIEGSEEQIKEMTMERARELYGEQLPEVVEKSINKELDSIINNGFAVLYLISHKLVKKSNEDGYLVGSRGSVGSSLVATLTGITEVNPLPPHYRCPECKFNEFILDGSAGSGADLKDRECPKCNTDLVKDGHDIPFEVFLGFKGDKVPDIDLNFSGEYQGEIMKYTEDLFGKEYVYRAGTIATVAERTAFGFIKKYLEESGRTARNAEVNRLVKGCSGVKRTTGQHPGGLMVVPKDHDIYDFTPIQRPADDQKSETTTTHFDYHAISSRLVKLDILGHDDPTVIKMLEDLTGVDATKIKLDDEKTMSIFSSVEELGVTEEMIKSKVGTFGIPEFGTRFVRKMLEDTRPSTFSELVRISGLSHGTDVWLNNAQELIQKGIAQLNETISTRDDIMTYLIYKGMEPTLAFQIMEGVRKGKGLKPEQEEAMRAAQVPRWYIDSCKKIKYMFPKAHAVAYVMMAFRIAYFKVNYPLAFYTTFYTVRADEFDANIVCKGKDFIEKQIIEYEKKGNDISTKEKSLLTILEVALEMYCRGVNIRRVSLEESHATDFLIVDNEILPPLSSLQGVGATAAQNIVAARENGFFNSIEDLRVRGRATKTVIEALDNHGCLLDLPATSQIELFS
ncbi:DNA polymerase-3 subunit alpha (Gram-positive type) [Desulfitispora alkaliphila]|uniref:PolC-type DNA polymerase III n=1 Tax=Desulfitispora alkaliphila TaxID=622674 RepID=UPI003D1CD9C5